MKAPKFSYVRATSIAHAVQLLAEHGDDARILAGGQSLMPTLNMRLSRPKLLIDVNRIDALKGIDFDGHALRIGAMTRHAELQFSHMAAKAVPLLTMALPFVAHVAVRNRGTFGGSIALADPAAEMPACLLAHDGLIGLESVRGRREIRASQYFHGLYQTARQPDELLIDVRIDAEPPDMRCAFHELSRRHGDFALAGIAARARHDGNRLSDVRLVYFGSEIKPTLAHNAMAAAEGNAWNETTQRSVMDALAKDLEPIDNILGKATTKLHWQRVLTTRALADITGTAKAPA